MILEMVGVEYCEEEGMNVEPSSSWPSLLFHFKL